MNENIIKQAIESRSPQDNIIALNMAVKSCSIPLDILQLGFNSIDTRVRSEAFKMAGNLEEVPYTEIIKGMNDHFANIRKYALRACRNRNDIPASHIQSMLYDRNPLVQNEAAAICREKGIEIPVIRSFEPPPKVYKKCENDVIVVATIPEDAQVRGHHKRKCRASKAKIINIIGDYFGEKIGISQYDLKTIYHIGDEVDIPNFDYSNRECGAGFHFFCSLHDAMNYIM